jgi:hypothetical protein
MKILNFDCGYYPTNLEKEVAKKCGIITSSETVSVGLWEERECKILRDDISSDSFCEKHSEAVAEVTCTWTVLGSGAKATRTKIFYRTPRILVAYNEGKYATTGVCLDCVKELL